MSPAWKFSSEIATILVIGVCGVFGATFQPGASVLNTTLNSTVPVYRFHYITKDEKTGDYKIQEEQRTGDSVTGSYAATEPSGDSRAVNYAADVANGFKADINVQQNGSPVKTNIGNPLPTATPYRDGIAPFSNYRTGISAPPRNRKPARGYNPIVVGAQPFVTIPYPTAIEAGNAALRNGSTMPIAKKSVQVDVTYNEDSIEKMEKKLASGATATTSLKNGDIDGMNNMNIPSTVLEIMNRDKAKAVSEKLLAFDAMIATDRNDSSKIDMTQNVTESLPIATSVVPTTPPIKKIVVPQRPMRLIGLSPIYMEMPQLQSIAENLTAVPQLHLEPFTNIQYATPAPFLSGPLLGGPVGPFRNLPRSVPETVNVPPDYPFVNSIPIFGSIPISAPIIAPPSSLPSPLPTNDNKVDTKNDNKTPQPGFPFCQDCILPTGFAATLPLVKMPAAAPVPAPGAGPQQLQKTQCPPNNAIAASQWNPYAPNFMYVLMPMPLMNKNKFNETRPATLPMWTK